MKRSVCAMLVLLLVPPLLYAQRTAGQEVFKILGLSVDGNLLSDAGAIIANSGLKVGEEVVVPGDQLGQAIRRLWSLNIFDDIKISVDRKIGEGAFLVIHVHELPRYDRTEIEGNDEISTDDMLKKISLIRGQVVPPEAMIKIQKTLKKMYEEEGYLLAAIDVHAEPVDTSKEKIILKIVIDEGNPVRVAHINFDGDSAYTDGDLRGVMDDITEKAWWKIFSSHRFDRKKYEGDQKRIVTFYRKNGYRDAEILGDSIWYSNDKEDMSILMHIYEGPQYHIRKVTWEGNTVYPAYALNERLNIAPGEIYNAEKLEQNLRGNEAQSDVSSLYLDNGYLTFNLEPVETRVGTDSLDLDIKVYERNKFRIGHVSIKGNTKTHEKVIRRELLTVPGDYFSRGAIIRSVRQLSVLNYFNPEKIKPDYQLEPDGETVNLTYEVEEKSSDNINASVGYSGAFGFTGALGFTINNFSIAEPLRGGAGQILNFEWQFGEASTYQTFTIGFTEPWLFDTPTLLGVSLFDTRQRFNFDLRQTGGTIRLGRRFKWPDIYWRGDWILSAQHNNVINGNGIYPEGVSTQVSITQIISRNSIDNPVFPSSGSNFSLSTELSGGPLPGTISFHKWNLNAEWYTPMFGTTRAALYLSTMYGYLSAFDKTTPIPPIELFFMGGTGLGYIATTPLRGYDDQSIGPKNLSGSSIGGRAMTKQTLELRYALAINPIPIYILAFAEGGNVFESLPKADLFDLKRSAGLGARLQINPIGLIGFDYGYGFDDVTGANGKPDGKPDGWHFHFVFGRGF